VLAHADEITKPKLKQNLIEHADAARLSRELVRLVCDSPLPEPLDALEMKGIPDEPLREFLEDQGFKTCSRASTAPVAGAAPRTFAVATPVQREVRPEPKIDRSPTRRSPTRRRSTAGSPRPRATACRARHRDGLHRLRHRQAGRHQPRHRMQPACYIPLEHGGTICFRAARAAPGRAGAGQAEAAARGPGVLKIGHNFKFDWVVFDRRGIKVAPIDDTLVMSFNLDAGGLASHAMDDLAKKHLDHQCLTFKEVCGSGQKQISFDKVPLDRATEYAAEDADVTLRLWKRFKPRLPHERVDAGLRDGRPAAGAGGGADGARGRQGRPRGAVQAVGRVQRPDRALEEQICAEAGCKFTIGSPSSWARCCSTSWA
jgi:DNA polymerase-1